jgi:hypothetical protein
LLFSPTDRGASIGPPPGQAELKMPENAITQIIEKVVSDVLEAHVRRVRSDLVERVLEQIQPYLEGSPAGAIASDNDPAALLRDISAIHAGGTQREILRALLDAAANHSGRVALFVIKSGAATGWQGRNFANSDEVKDFALNVTSGVCARAMDSRSACAGNSTEVDSQFVSRFGDPADSKVLLLPLLLKEKVAALIYADAGNHGKLNAPALELLVVSASAWLEVIALRKHSVKEEAAEVAVSEKASAAIPKPSFSDPFADHAAAHAATPAPVEMPLPAVPVVAAEIPAAAHRGAAAAVALAPDSLNALSPEDADVHRKAQRFARLLVDEIKLYNQAKMIEGRKNRDLYDRLKEDIDKSHATYQKRFAGTVAARAGYFNREVVCKLAEDDISLMGANFQR